MKNKIKLILFLYLSISSGLFSQSSTDLSEKMNINVDSYEVEDGDLSLIFIAKLERVDNGMYYIGDTLSRLVHRSQLEKDEKAQVSTTIDQVDKSLLIEVNRAKEKLSRGHLR